jgi:hypothetical protein
MLHHTKSQICATVAVQELSGGRVRMLGYNGDGRFARFRVGRLDSEAAAPVNQLPDADTTTTEFMTFFQNRGFTPDEAVSLMGSHSLIDDQASPLQARKRFNGNLTMLDTFVFATMASSVQTQERPGC